MTLKKWIWYRQTGMKPSKYIKINNVHIPSITEFQHIIQHMALFWDLDQGLDLKIMPCVQLTGKRSFPYSLLLFTSFASLNA